MEKGVSLLPSSSALGNNSLMGASNDLACMPPHTFSTLYICCQLYMSLSINHDRLDMQQIAIKKFMLV